MVTQRLALRSRRRIWFASFLQLGGCCSRQVPVFSDYQLAHVLGLSVTAESVETAAQFTRLRELGCDTGQGWYFATALPAEQIPALLHAPTWPQPQHQP